MTRLTDRCVVSLRTALSRWLDPEAHKKALRYWYLRQTLEDAQRWLGYDFPEVDRAIFWAKVTEVNYFRALDEAAVAPVPLHPGVYSIWDFREVLRRERSPLGASPAERPALPRETK